MVDYGPDQFVCLMYYTNGGYSCPEHSQRANYYSQSGTPHAVFDGFEHSIGGFASGSMYDYYLPIVQEHLTNPSPVEMSLSMDIDAGTINVTGTIEALGNVLPCQVYVAVYEEPAPREPHLCRGFAVWQETLTAVSNGQTQNISGSVAVGSGWVEGNLSAVMFIQYVGQGSALVAGAGPGPGGANRRSACPVRSWWGNGHPRNLDPQ